ncbi:hypothetical protein GQ55_7G262200 [Panicum hallii var. hallii]|uniref:Probable purine permease n=1 Tax=Panicum hallii var. hallii TaxID=1504633 RepID=A0A2T7CZG7_9POAL|nr:hypothetical protein GQ55_7G262200 [Panicum hallii var. hallii]
MAHAQEIQLQIRGVPDEESVHEDGRDGSKAATRRSTTRGSFRWWMTVAVDMLMVLCGTTVATLLGRLYYNSGGNSKWMATLTQSGGSPLLVVPLLMTPAPSAEERRPAASKLWPIYAGIGVLIGFDNLMYSYALQYLPVSTFSLVAATQLAFNAITSRLINAQRFTALIANSVMVLTFSAALLGVGSSSDGTSSSGSAPRGKYTVGFALVLAASAAFALIMSLFEATFEKVIRARTLRWVLSMQMYTNLVASAVSVAGLLASGDWRTIPAEMAAFKDGRARYVLTLAGTAVAWQAAAVGVVRLIARVSSLFANVTATLALPLVPVLAVALFGDRMTGIKVVAMLMAVWGFLSYVYQHYVDGRRAGRTHCRVCAARAGSDEVLPA